MDWHGLAQIGTDWHGLARIGKLANLCRDKKLAPDWHRIGMDWHGLARIGTGLAGIGSDWPGLADWRICFVKKKWRRIGIGLAQDWHWIGQLALDWPIDTGSADWHQIGSGLARIGSDWLGLANWRICVVTKS